MRRHMTTRDTRRTKHPHVQNNCVESGAEESWQTERGNARIAQKSIATTTTAMTVSARARARERARKNQCRFPQAYRTSLLRLPPEQRLPKRNKNPPNAFSDARPVNACWHLRPAAACKHMLTQWRPCRPPESQRGNGCPSDEPPL